MNDKNKLPEAPASITYSVISPNGFPALFTIRDEKIGLINDDPTSENDMGLLYKMEVIEKKFVEKGYKPQQPRMGGFPKKEIEYVEGRKCPVCGGRVIKNGNPKGPEFKCEFQKYNFTTKLIEGCKWNDWGKNSTKVPAVSNY